MCSSSSLSTSVPADFDPLPSNMFSRRHLQVNKHFCHQISATTINVSYNLFYFTVDFFYSLHIQSTFQPSFTVHLYDHEY